MEKSLVELIADQASELWRNGMSITDASSTACSNFGQNGMFREVCSELGRRGSATRKQKAGMHRMLHYQGIKHKCQNFQGEED